jgi:FdrA protein
MRAEGRAGGRPCQQAKAVSAAVSVEQVEVRPGAYADSVTLMEVTAAVRNADGVTAALVAMATALNLELLAGLGFAAPGAAEPGDMLVAVRARDEAALAAARELALALLAARSPATAGPGPGQPPRTVGSACRAAGGGGATVALISVPGRHAFAEAMDALEAGCHVMIFSDNVPAWQEVLLKDRAAERGLLVMGPDCGTAVLAGVGLGFSHTLRRGPVGLVAASGTGAQQVLCLLDAAGVGVSAVVGVGGRDLSAAVGGRGTRAALAALDADPGTEMILVISKPPAAAVAAQLRAHARRLATPVCFGFVAEGELDLTAVTEALLAALGHPVPAWPSWRGSTPAPRSGGLRGLFAGGTLCEEAMVIAAGRLGPVRSNVPLRPGWRASPQAPPPGHVMIDFGDDELTAGRPHPIIDQSLRLERLAAEAADPGTAVILLDVVLGHGAHPDPAAELAPVIAAAAAPVVVSLIGAGSDPQGLAGQARALQEAGAEVFASNAQAARYACSLVAGST